MPSKSRLNWTPQEDKMLKCLKEDEKINGWNLIAQKLRKVFLFQRTSKQCRERYTSTARFLDSMQEKTTWSLAQEKLLSDLYLQHGSKWSIFVTYFPNKSQNTIKNRFYSCMRKCLRKMNDLSEKYNPSRKSFLKVQMLLTILELSRKIQIQCQDLIGFKADTSMQLLKIRNNILKASLECAEINDEQMLNLVSRIHKLNCSLRHLGIFKVKNKKTWKLDQKRLLFIFAQQKDELEHMKKKVPDEVHNNKQHTTALEPTALIPTSNTVLEQQNFPELKLVDMDIWPKDFNKRIFGLLDEDSAPNFLNDFIL